MRKIIIILIILAVVSTLIGCSTGRGVVEQVSKDTMFLSKIEYDSIYIDNILRSYQSADTVFLERTRYEYKYKMHTDTVIKTRVDSIPVVSEVEIVKEVSHIPWWSKALSSLGFVFILLIILSIITKNRII